MNPSPPPTPERAARDMLRALAGAGSPRRAADVQRYFKETVEAFGVPLPEIRRRVSELARSVKRAWTAEDALAFCEAMIRDPHLEAKATGLGLLERYAKELTAEHLPVLERWLERHASNWATVDDLAPHLVGALVDRHASVRRRVIAWSGSPVLWVRRASAVSFIVHARRGRYLDEAYRVAERLFGDREDLIHKATGWLLREAGKTDLPRLEAFLLRHGPRIPRTTLRYAIERFPEKDRKRLLAATRGA